jgi:hypothetical protein
MDAAAKPRQIIFAKAFLGPISGREETACRTMAMTAYVARFSLGLETIVTSP